MSLKAKTTFEGLCVRIPLRRDCTLRDGCRAAGPPDGGLEVRGAVWPPPPTSLPCCSFVCPARPGWAAVICSRSGCRCGACAAPSLQLQVHLHRSTPLLRSCRKVEQVGEGRSFGLCLYLHPYKDRACPCKTRSGLSVTGLKCYLLSFPGIMQFPKMDSKFVGF